MLDETINATQDTHPQGKAPGEAAGTTPGGEPETYTKTQLDEAVQKARIKAGRDAKALELREAQLKERESAIKEAERRQEEAESEQYRDDPKGLNEWQTKRRLQREKEEFARDKTAFAEKLARADELEIEINVWKSAQAHGVDANTLKEKCKKFKLTSDEQIEDMAETLSASKPPEKPPLKVDSGKGLGGAGISGKSPREMISDGLKKLNKK